MPKPLHGREINRSGQHKVRPIDDPLKQRFLDWLCTPQAEREPRKMEDLAAEMGVSRQTLTNWKTKDKEFLEAWEVRYLNTIGSPERKQKIMDVLFRTATDPDDPKHVTAAKTYYEIEGSLKPTSRVEVVSKSASDLTDEELRAMIAEKASDALDARQRAS